MKKAARGKIPPAAFTICGELLDLGFRAQTIHHLGDLLSLCLLQQPRFDFVEWRETRRTGVIQHDHVVTEI